MMCGSPGILSGEGGGGAQSDRRTYTHSGDDLHSPSVCVHAFVFVFVCVCVCVGSHTGARCSLIPFTCFNEHQ